MSCMCTFRCSYIIMNYTARGIVDKELDLIMRVTDLTQTSLGGQLINHNHCKGVYMFKHLLPPPPPPPPPPPHLIVLAMSMECTQNSTGFINYDLVTNMSDCLHAHMQFRLVCTDLITSMKPLYTHVHTGLHA